jgi:hypothetical protein
MLHRSGITFAASAPVRGAWKINIRVPAEVYQNMGAGPDVVHPMASPDWGKNSLAEWAVSFAFVVVHAGLDAAGSGWFRSIKIAAAATRFVQFYGTVTGPRADSGVVIGLKLQLDVEPMTGIEPAYSAWEAVSASARATIRVPGHRSAMYPTSVSQ